MSFFLELLVFVFHYITLTFIIPQNRIVNERIDIVIEFDETCQHHSKISVPPNLKINIEQILLFRC